MEDFWLQNLEGLFDNTPVEPLPSDRPIVIFSDFHAGVGNIKDDFRHNADLTMEALEEYYRRGFLLILNGDVEELQKFRFDKIYKRWQRLFGIFDRFEVDGRLIKLVGNHDDQLLYDNPRGTPVRQSLRYRYGDDDIFIFHGHQASKRYALYNHVVGWMLKHIVGRLPIRNTSVSHDNRKKKVLEERVYAFSNQKGIVSIIGHTHRPLFESLSKTDQVKYNIERLCRQYITAGEAEKETIQGEIKDLRTHLERALQDSNSDTGSIYHDSFVVPCMFNSGCVLGKRGITCIEIAGGEISLKYWFDKKRSKRYLRYEEYATSRLRNSNYYETEIKRESLDYIFSRIHLLT